jgi:hypothetical protein
MLTSSEIKAWILLLEAETDDRVNGWVLHARYLTLTNSLRSGKYTDEEIELIRHLRDAYKKKPIEQRRVLFQEAYELWSNNLPREIGPDGEKVGHENGLHASHQI